METDIFLLGSTGFIGREFVAAAVKSGARVRALVRSQEGAAQMAQLGAAPVLGDAGVAGPWIEELKGAAALIDLVQPKLPKRLGKNAIQAVAAERVQVTRTVVSALLRLPVWQRPVLLSVSGVSDLEPDADGRISHRSRVPENPTGFAHIGLPVRRVIADSEVEATFVHLGTVYGPGKTFAARLLPDLARGKARIVGRGANRMAIVHVADAAAALVHLASTERAAIVGRTWVVADGADTSQSEFLEHAASLMGGPPPRRVPVWVASLFAGKVLAELLSRDCPVNPAALVGSGFRFQYPSHRSGMLATVEALGRTAAPTPRIAGGSAR